MELNNFKERIQNSGITPSEASWKKLSERLSYHEKKKNNNKKVWFKYVATIAIIVTVGIYFLRSDKSIIEEKISTTTPIITSPSLNTSEGKQEIVITELPINENSSEATSIESAFIENQSIAFSEIENYTDDSTKITEQTGSVNKGTDKIQMEDISGESVISENKIVTDDEIDALLKNALHNLEHNSNSIDKGRINGNSLLGEVEYEIEHEYKRKLFEKVIISLPRPKEIELTDRSK